MKRRSFLAGSSAAFCAPRVLAAASERRRVAVIGHTGRGNYGHGLDTVWLQVPETVVAAVADPHPEGLAQAKQRLGATGYADYREMLRTEKPEFVAVCPRHADQHAEMALAAVESGARGIYIEKPFVRTPAEADRLREACRKHGARIAVAHRNAYHPVIDLLAGMIDEGELGKLLEIRGRGKGDRRGGGEDLWVLGSHVMNLLHRFGGAPRTCSAVVLQDGEPVTAAHVQDGPEGLGPLAGNELHARYEMESGVIATFDSIANDQTSNAGFGLQLIGSAGLVNIQADRDPVAHLVPGNPFQPTREARPWIPITTAGVGKPEGNPELIKQVQEHVVAVRDLIAACDEGRAPLCDLEAGATTVEMICAVFASHREGGRAVPIPLAERGNALAKLGAPPATGAVKVKPRPPAPGPPWPTAKAIEGKPGWVFNPFNGGEVDVRGIPSGTLVRDADDPDPAHKFRIP